MEQSPSSELFSLTIDPLTKTYLTETARWGRFLAIIGFIICGLIVLTGIFLGSFLSFLGRSDNNELGGNFNAMAGAGAVAIGVLNVLIGLLYFFPCLYLFRFANKMKAALASNNQQDLDTSFQNLKSLFKFVGILTVIALAFYAFAIVITIVAGTAFHR